MKKPRRSAPFSAVLLAALALTFLTSKYICQLALVEGDSMLPALHSGQLVFVDKTAKAYEVGDVVLFSCKALNSTLVKRIAGQPGDRIMIEGGRLYRNGVCAAGYGADVFAGMAEEELTVPEGCYFVLGDNIAESVDSRDESVGFVAADDISGRVYSAFLSPSSSAAAA